MAERFAVVVPVNRRTDHDPVQLLDPSEAATTAS